MKQINVEVLKTIKRMELEQESSAYFELVCSAVFGEMTEDSEKKLILILKELEECKFININGDRISVIKDIDFI